MPGSESIAKKIIETDDLFETYRLEVSCSLELVACFLCLWWVLSYETYR